MPRTSRLADIARQIGFVLLLPIYALVWPLFYARQRFERRELARMHVVGKPVVEVHADPSRWLVRFTDDSQRALSIDDIRGGTRYTYEDHYQGFANTTWQPILRLELVDGEPLVLLGPVACESDADDPLLELSNAAIATGRVRGPVLRYGGNDSLIDMFMIAVWSIALVIGLGLLEKALR